MEIIFLHGPEAMTKKQFNNQTFRKLCDYLSDQDSSRLPSKRLGHKEPNSTICVFTWGTLDVTNTFVIFKRVFHIDKLQFDDYLYIISTFIPTLILRSMRFRGSNWSINKTRNPD